MDNPDLAPVAPTLENSLILITLQVCNGRANEAVAFYQNAFGATEQWRDVVDVGIRRAAYSRLRRTVVLRLNAHHSIRIQEIDCPPQNFAHHRNISMIHYIYVDNPAGLVAQAVAAGAHNRGTQEEEGGFYRTLLQDPFRFYWMIESSIMAPNLGQG